MRRAWAYLLGLSVVVGCVLTARGAEAQIADEPGSQAAPPPVAEPAPPVAAAPAPPPAAPPPAVNWESAPAPVDESVHNHDGFFLRMDLGFGPGWYKEEISGQELGTASGVTGMFAIQLGGTLFPGFVLGGGLVGNNMVNPKWKDSSGATSTTSDMSLGLSEIQIFAAYYPDPHGGLHLLGSAGYGSLSMTIDNTSYDVNMAGLVVGGGIGYDFWVSSQWSLGPMFVVTHGMLNGTSNNSDYKATFTAPVLAFTATYH